MIPLSASTGGREFFINQWTPALAPIESCDTIIRPLTSEANISDFNNAEVSICKTPSATSTTAASTPSLAACASSDTKADSIWEMGAR